MDKRALDESAAVINAACRDWSVPIGGGAMAMASEVKVSGYRWHPEEPLRYGIQARVERAWYWLTDGQIAGMVRQSRTLASV